MTSRFERGTCGCGLRPYFAGDPLALRTFAAVSLACWPDRNVHFLDTRNQIEWVKRQYNFEEPSDVLREALNNVLDRDSAQFLARFDAETCRVIV